MSYWNISRIVRFLGVAAVAVAVATVGGVAQAAAPGPSSPSSYAAQPEPEQEETNQGSWQWVMTTPSNPSDMPQPTLVPEHPKGWVINGPFGNNGSGSTTATGSDAVGSAQAMVSASGSGGNKFAFNSINWTIGGSVTNDSYAVVWTREWTDGYDNDGDSTPVKAAAVATATGNAQMQVKSIAGADQGSSASCTADASGSCSGLGKTIGSMPDKSVTAAAQYTAVSNTLGVSGNIGPKTPDNPAPNVTGSFSANEGFTANGQGVATGAASYSISGSVSADTNTELTISEAGVAQVNAGGEGQEPGLAGLLVSASVNFSDAP